MSADRVDVIGNLRMALQHVVLCAPDDVVQKSIEESADVLADLIAFARSFRIKVVDNFYQDAYLHINFSKGGSYPHGKSISYRLPTPSTMSPDLAEIERMRVTALSRIAQPGDGDGN